MEGRNVAVEFRWAHGDYDRLPALAAELVGRNVAVLVGVGGDNSAVAAKRATSTIPIIFGMGGDPIKAGLVESLTDPAAMRPALPVDQSAGAQAGRPHA